MDAAVGAARWRDHFIPVRKTDIARALLAEAKLADLADLSRARPQGKLCAQ